MLGSDRRAALGANLSQVLQHVRQRQDIGVFLVHIEQVDGVGGFVPVKHTFFHDDHAEPVGAAVQNAGPDAAAGGLAHGDDGVHVMGGQVADQRCSPESAGRVFAHDRLAVDGSYLVNDVINVRANV